ncbi:MAG: tetratricopeptide repeat protein [Prolixibacteraceae bacterium]|nr:tetratricopeptide repeat protein [Prolixibacteraceae bacterium]
MNIKENISRILAENYFQAANAECDMFRITNILEDIRKLAETEDFIKIENHIEIKLGESIDNELEFTVVQRLKEQTRELKREVYKNEILTAFKKNKESGWNKWIEVFGYELTKTIEDNLNFLINLKIPATNDAEFQKIKKLVPYVINERWPETIPLFNLFTSKKNISDEIKGELHALVAQIYLYHLWDFEKALEQIDKIKTLLPDSSKAERTLGEYHIQNNNFDEARNHLQKAMELDKKDVENFLVLGNLYKAENRFETAEKWYNEGIRVNPGKADLYNRILLLNEHEPFYKRHEKNIDSLLEKIVKLDSEFTFTALGNAGFVHQKNRNFEKAEAYYSRVTDMFPDRILGYINLAYSYLDKNDFKKSEEAFLQSVKIDPNTFDGYWGLVALNKKKEDWNAVISNLDRCEKLRPEWNYHIYNDYGNAYEKLNDIENAIKYYRLALENDPERIIGLNALLDIAELDVPPEKGLKILNSIRDIKTAEFNNDYHYRSGTILFKNKKYEEALEHFVQILSFINSDPVKLEYLGLTYEKLGAFDQAEIQYKKSVDVATTGKDKFYNRLAFYLTNQNRCDEAIDILNKALAIKQEPLYFENRGYAREILNDFDNAKQDYQTAIDLAKTDIDSFENRMGVFCYNRQLYTDAIKHYSKAIEILPKAVYFENIGLAYENSGDLKNAEENYRKALEISTGNKDIYWNRLGIFYYNQKNYKEAISYYSKAIEIQPKAVYYENRGNAFIDNGDFHNAEENFSKAHETEPQNYIHLENLGLVSQKKQNYSVAINYFEQALSIAPENVKSFFYNYIGNCWYSLENWNEAADFYRNAINRDKNQQVYFDNLILALKNGNRINEAINVIEDRLKIDPLNYSLNNQLGIFYIEIGAYKKAATCFEKNTITDPSNALGYDNLAYVYELMYQFEEAVKIYIHALRLFPNETVFIENFGKSLLNIPEENKKKKYYEKAIGINELDKSRITFLNELL